ncbi:hypothetical protein RP20_CCG014676 [Aedes albopictus]|nr:hypothetical protein RP20_CCG014676 [Aedes albopictus]
MPRRKEPAASILSNSTNSSLAMAGPSSAGFPQPGSSSASSSSAKKESGEKNKVKFSDTVTVAVVPEIPRKDKQGEKSRKPPYSSMIADPKRELAESLPLCHPNDDYLKDFTPMQGKFSSPNKIKESLSSVTVVFVPEIMSNSSDQHQHQQQQQHHQQLENADNENNKKIPNIKVVHFGVV